MKALSLCIIAAVIVFLVGNSLRVSMAEQSTDPEKAMKHLYWNFPRGKGFTVKKPVKPGAPPTAEIHLYRPPLDPSMRARFSPWWRWKPTSEDQRVT